MSEQKIGWRKIDEAAVKEFHETTKRWTGRCRHCGEELTGTLSELRAHVCAIPHK